MSSPRNKSSGPAEIREGTRVVLKEITASLHNSPVKQTSQKSGNVTAIQKSPEHAVKVQFAREFADVKTTTPPATESLSSASSFQSLSSTLSSKSSSGICVDSAPGSPGKCADTSYINSDIPGLDDIIAACAGIKLSEQGELPVDLQLGIEDLSQDQTFASAVGDLSIVEEDPEESSPKEKSKLNETFEVDYSVSDPPENPLPKSDQLSVQDSSSVVPYVSFEDSILKAYAFQSVNKDSLVFSTAVEFQNLEGLASKTTNEEKSSRDTSDPQNEILIKSDSSNVELHCNTSTKSVKNELVDLIFVNDNILAPFERTQSLTFPLLANVSNISTILEKDESIKDVRVISPNSETTLPEQIHQHHVLDSKILKASGESYTKDNLKSSTQEAEIKSEITVPVSPQIPEKDKQVTQEISDVSPPDQIHQHHVLDSKIPKASDESHTKDNLKSSTEETEIKSEITVPVSLQIPEEDKQVTQETSDVSQESVSDSTYAIIFDEVQPQVSGETVKDTAGVESPLKDFDLCFEPEKIKKSPLKSLISQSILDKIAEQQKSLDATFAVDEEENQAEVIKPGSCNSSNQEENLETNLNISSVIGTSPKSQSSVPSTLLYESSLQQNTVNSTKFIIPEKNAKSQENVTNAEGNLSTPEQLPKNKEIARTSSPAIQFVQQTTLNSTVIIASENCKQTIPAIQIFSPEKSFDDSTLRNSNIQSDSLNSTVEKEIQETSSVEVLKNDSQFEIPQTETPKRPTEKDSINEVAKEIAEDIKSIVKTEVFSTVKKGIQETISVLRNDSQFEIPQTETPKRPAEKDPINKVAKEIAEDIKSIVKTEIEGTIEEASAPAELDSTVILEGSDIDLEAPDVTAVRVNLTPGEDYETFKPQQQSTELTLENPSILDKVELEAQAIAKEIYDKSLELVDDNEQFVSATSELFQDPTSFDFLLSQGSSNNRARDLRFESLYVKFDPLVNRSMLPQGNSQTEDEEQNGKNETPPVPNIDTPKRNPAIAAIDRLLFYSPVSTGLKTEETKDIKQETAETSPQESVPIIDEKMAKELELVRSLVVQLEEKLEKLEKDREEDNKKHLKEVKKQYEDYRKLEEKNSRLEAQLAQEIESKKQVTVVLDEYERSISRLVAERERDRADLEEKTRMKEELQAASQHLSNTEAAFNDVHQKYERLKGVVAAYKSNEAVLKESVQENVETIKALENRYEQLKSHAMAQLEKANQELETIRKQNEAETVKLQAMLKKAELKSKSLTDLVDQKTKENKELTQILDEVIARVGNQNTE